MVTALVAVERAAVTRRQFLSAAVEPAQGAALLTYGLVAPGAKDPGLFVLGAAGETARLPRHHNINGQKDYVTVRERKTGKEGSPPPTSTSHKTSSSSYQRAAASSTYPAGPRAGTTTAGL